MAQKAHQPTDKTRQQVEFLSAIGNKLADVARVIGVSDKTLTKYYSKEIECGKVNKNAQMAGALYKAGLKGNVTAMIFWLKTQAGWSEPRAAVDVDLQLSDIIRRVLPKPTDDYEAPD